MSSAPRVIVLDSNAYFRLARSIHPLLSQPFGDPPPYALKLLKLMVDCKRIDITKVQEVIEYWEADNDLPLSKQDFELQYRKLFNGNRLS